MALWARVVVRRLIESGQSVRCLLRKNSNTSRIADLRFERAILDVRDAASLHSAFHGCNTRRPPRWDCQLKYVRSKEMDDVVVGGTRNVLAAAKSAGCRGVVYVSSILAISSSLKPQIFAEITRPDPEMLQLVASNAKIGADKLRPRSRSQWVGCGDRQCRGSVRSGRPLVDGALLPLFLRRRVPSLRLQRRNLHPSCRTRRAGTCRGSGVKKGSSAARISQSGNGEGGTLKLLNRTSFQLPNSLVRFLAWTGSHLRLPLPFNPKSYLATRYWFMDSRHAGRN